MNHFGMETATSKPTKNCFPSELCKTSSIKDKRKRLFDQTAQPIVYQTLVKQVPLHQHHFHVDLSHVPEFLGIPNAESIMKR